MSIFKDKWGNWRDGWVIVGFLLLIPIAMALVFLLFSPIILPLAFAECRDIGVQTALATKWTLWHGCYIQWHGQWLTEEMFRAITIMP